LELRKIIEELKRERDRIDQAINALEQVGSITGRRGRAARQPGPPRRRRLTPEGRKRLSDMMKKRWAERKRRAKAA
jgi:DNA-binding PadR family transcriptional regulator